MSAIGCTIKFSPREIPSLPPPPLPDGIEIRKIALRMVEDDDPIGWLSEIGQYQNHVHNGAKFEWLTWSFRASSLDIKSISNGLKVYRPVAPVRFGLCALAVGIKLGKKVSKMEGTMYETSYQYLEADEKETAEIWKPLRRKGIKNFPQDIGKFFR